MKLCMIGTGYVGLVSGVCFADLGNDVICVDNDINKINLLKKGKIPIYEPGLSELVIKNYKNKRLNFSSNLNKSVKSSDIIFICVGTPTKKNGSSADLSQIYNVSKEISSSINKFKIIITKSTVPVTTGDEIEKILSKRNNKKKISVVSNPEFLREGEAIRDFTFPDRVVGGSCFPKDTKAIISTAEKFKTDLSLIKSVIKSNENRSKILLDRINQILNKKIKNKKITFLGVTFKANTDDMRDSSSLKLIPWLSKKGAIIKYFDPTGYKDEFSKLKNVTNKTTIKDAIQGSDLIIIHTEWNDFKSINFKNLVKGKKIIIFDMRNIYSSTKIKEQGFKYYSVGK